MMRKTLSVILLLAMFLANAVTPVLATYPFAKRRLAYAPSPVSPPPSPPPAPCAPGTFTFSGSSSTTGTAGNIRTFTANGVSVKASGFSRRYSNGSWATGYLGLYSEGLGVTDGSEDGANGSHRVDNIGSGDTRRNNYVLFEFSVPVVVDQAFLANIGADSDATFWIGTAVDPFNNHNSLSDAFLSGLLQENNDGATADRWANVNASAVAGNVLVIAARPDGSNDEFKINKVAIQCQAAPTPTPTPTPTPAPCSPGTFTLTGNSATDGPDGNIRTFSAGPVNVHASAFSAKKSNFDIETAYLGAYANGLGVTDRGEGNGNAGRDRLDNIGDRYNAILFEFSSVVVPDKMFLDDVGLDSDMLVVIGSAADPYNHHLTVTGAMFGGAEINDGANAARLADINAGNVSGNWMLVIPRLT